VSAPKALRGVIGGVVTAGAASFRMKSQIDPSQPFSNLPDLVLRDDTEVKLQRDFAKASGKTSIAGDISPNDNVVELVVERKESELGQESPLRDWKLLLQQDGEEAGWPPGAALCGVGVPKGEAEETVAGLGAAVEISSSA